MPRKTSLESAIAKAAQAFAMEIVEAVKGASLQELIALQGGKAPKRRGRKPGPKPKAAKAKKKPGRKPGRPKKTAAKRGPGRPKKAATKKKVTAKKAVKKKRVVKNYPKCAYPRCNKNRFPRGKGFCGDHWRQWKAGKIKDAESYKKK